MLDLALQSTLRSAIVTELSLWMDRQDDDYTVVVLKHGAEAALRAA